MAVNTGQPSSLGMDEKVSASVTKSRHPDTHSSTADTGGTFLFTHRYPADKAKKKNGGQYYETHIYLVKLSTMISGVSLQIMAHGKSGIDISLEVLRLILPMVHN